MYSRWFGIARNVLGVLYLTQNFFSTHLTLRMKGMVQGGEYPRSDLPCVICCLRSVGLWLATSLRRRAGWCVCVVGAQYRVVEARRRVTGNVIARYSKRTEGTL